MKKIVLFACLIIFGSAAFANIELDTCFYGTVFGQKTLDSDYAEKYLDTKFKQGIGFGKEDSISLFFGHHAGIFDVGLGFLENFDFYSNSYASSNDYKGTGINLGFGMGPVFRLTFTDHFSLFIRPSFILNVHTFAFTERKEMDLMDSLRMTDFSIGSNLNIGGRTWILNTSGYHLGLAYGADFSFTGGSGHFSTKGISTMDYKLYSLATKIYLGLCMNFGDRGIDR